MRKARCTCSSTESRRVATEWQGCTPFAAVRGMSTFLFPFAREGNSKLARGRARKRLLRRAHASESRNAFLYSPSRGCMKFAFGRRVIRDWIFYHRGIELRVLSGDDHLPPVKYLQDFYNNIVRERTLFQCTILTGTEKRVRMFRGEERKSLCRVLL